MPTCVPSPLPRPPEALLRSTVARVSKIMPGGVAGVQVGHVITYRGSPEGFLIYTVFTKKCQKRSKRGYPCFYRFSNNRAGTLGPPPPCEPSEARLVPGVHPPGTNRALPDVIWRWGS